MLADAPGNEPEVILIATGSEVILVVEAHEKLIAEGIRSRVVSMPSWEIFEQQSAEYQNSVLTAKCEGPGCRRAGVSPWLGAICWALGSGNRHENFRSVGSA